MLEAESVPERSSARSLEAALIATWVVHGLAMLAMAALLLPAMPGGPTPLDADRIAVIADHPWRFRLGWLPWHLTAASDLWLAVALVRTRWVPRGPAWCAVVLTVLAVALDQGAQLAWITTGVGLATDARRTGDAAAYLAFEGWAFPMTGVWAALLYTLGALAWTACFAGAKTWSRALTWLSVPTWGVFGVVTVGPLLPAPFTLPKPAIAAGNAIGFVLMMVWLALVAERVFRRARPLAEHGRSAIWRAPVRGAWGAALGAAANSRVARRMCSFLPVIPFRSDITDVVYVNYLVPSDRLASWVPEGLALQTLGPDGRWAMFTFLTYRHGHFGPAFLGPLRRLFASPVQSNWRTYVRDDRTGREGIYFVTNAVTTTLHSLGARLMSEGMPMHLAARGDISRDAQGAVRVALEPGAGSAPDAAIALHPTPDRALAGPWAVCFASYEAMLAYAVPQDRAMSTLAAERTTVRQEIDLGIPIASCEPLTGTVRSEAAARIVGDASAVCFRVPAVRFLFTGELHDRWDEGAPTAGNGASRGGTRPSPA